MTPECRHQPRIFGPCSSRATTSSSCSSVRYFTCNVPPPLARWSIVTVSPSVSARRLSRTSVLASLPDCPAALALARLRAAAVARHRLDLAHVEALVDDLVRQLLGVRLADQHARVARRELAGVDIGLHLLRQMQQPQRVGDMASALADDLGDVFLRVTVFVGEREIAARFLQRIEIAALDVLDDRQFERFGVADVEHDDRNFMQARALRRAPAPLAGDDLVVVGAARPHHDRLDDAALADRVGELRKLGIGKQFARIARIGAHELDRHLALAARAAFAGLRLHADVAHQRCEAASQS